MLPTIAVKTSPIIILPTMDLKFHALDVFIKELPSWIDFVPRFVVTFRFSHCRSSPLGLSISPCPEYRIGALLLFIRHTDIERLELRDELLQLIQLDFG